MRKTNALIARAPVAATLLALPAALLAMPGTAHAEDAPVQTVDIGVVQDQDINVVQELLYPKEGRTELGVHLGWMPFDAFTTTPVAQLTFGSHLSERFGWEAGAGGGYGLKNGSMRTLSQPEYAKAPDAYRYLASAWGGVQWAPIYAKMNWLGKSVIHHDVYVTGSVGATLEQAILPDNAIAVAPDLGVGIGMRFFVNDKTTLRVQLKDEVLIQYREKTADTKGVFVKQNAAITAGVTFLGKRK